MSTEQQLKLGFVGAGALGTTLAVAFSQRGYQVTAAASRRRASAERLGTRVPGCAVVDTPQQVADAADLVLLTTPDDAISKVASSLRWRSGQAAVHCSGAYSRDALVAAEEQGAHTGTLHPMQTFTDVDSGLRNLEGTFFGIEGEGELLETLQAMARDLGGEPVVLRSQDKALYHASGMMACGFVLAMLRQASLLWEALGLSQEHGVRALLPMTRSTLAGAAQNGLAPALSGPLARGDAGTIRRHLDALSSQAPQVVPLYCTLALATLPLAEEKGRAPKERLLELRRLLEETLETHSLSSETTRAGTRL